MESRQPSVKVEKKYKIQSLTLTHTMDQAPCIEPEALSELRWFLECYLKAGAHKGKIILQDAKILQQYKLKQKGRKDKLMTLRCHPQKILLSGGLCSACEILRLLTSSGVREPIDIITESQGEEIFTNIKLSLTKLLICGHI